MRLYSDEFKTKIKKKTGAHFAVLFFVAAVFIVIYILSIQRINNFWITLLIGVLGAGLCGIYHIFFICPKLELLKLFKNMKNGLETTEKLRFLRFDEGYKIIGGISYRILVFEGIDDKQQKYTKEFYIDAVFEKNEFAENKNYLLKSFNSILTFFEIVHD